MLCQQGVMSSSHDGWQMSIKLFLSIIMIDHEYNIRYHRYVNAINPNGSNELLCIFCDACLHKNHYIFYEKNLVSYSTSLLLFNELTANSRLYCSTPNLIVTNCFYMYVLYHGIGLGLNEELLKRFCRCC